MKLSPQNIIRLLICVCLTVLGYYAFWYPMTALTEQYPAFTLLRHLFIFIHSTGHYIVFPLSHYGSDWSTVLHAFMGPLMQWGMPALMLWHWNQRMRSFPFFVTVFFLGVSFLISVPYIADANDQYMKLWAGENRIHDWYTILSFLRLNHLAYECSRIMMYLGKILILCSVIGTWFVFIKQGKGTEAEPARVLNLS